MKLFEKRKNMNFKFKAVDIFLIFFCILLACSGFVVFCVYKWEPNSKAITKIELDDEIKATKILIPDDKIEVSSEGLSISNLEYNNRSKVLKSESNVRNSLLVKLSSKDSEVNWREWRCTEAGLNNIYSEKNVMAIRDSLVESYLALYHKAVNETNLSMKIELKKSAKKQLDFGLLKLQEIAGNVSNCDEANLSLSELNLLAGNYDKACDYGQRVISADGKNELVAQAYYYLDRCYMKMGNKEKSKEYSNILLSDFPEQADRILGLNYRNYPIETMFRRQCMYLECAEVFDYLIASGVDSSINIKERDKLISLAYRSEPGLLEFDDSVSLNIND